MHLPIHCQRGLGTGSPAVHCCWWHWVCAISLWTCWYLERVCNVRIHLSVIFPQRASWGEGRKNTTQPEGRAPMLCWAAVPTAATIIILIILLVLLLCIIHVFPFHWLLGFVLVKDGHEILNICLHDLSTCVLCRRRQDNTLTRLYKCWLRRTEKWLFTLSRPGVKPWPLTGCYCHYTDPCALANQPWTHTHVTHRNSSNTNSNK